MKTDAAAWCELSDTMCQLCLCVCVTASKVNARVCVCMCRISVTLRCNVISLFTDNRQTVSTLCDITHDYSRKHFGYCSNSWVSDTLSSDVCVQTVLQLEDMNMCFLRVCTCVCVCFTHCWSPELLWLMIDPIHTSVSLLPIFSILLMLTRSLLSTHLVLSWLTLLLSPRSSPSHSPGVFVAVRWVAPDTRETEKQASTFHINHLTAKYQDNYTFIPTVIWINKVNNTKTTFASYFCFY